MLVTHKSLVPTAGSLVSRLVVPLPESLSVVRSWQIYLPIRAPPMFVARTRVFILWTVVNRLVPGFVSLILTLRQVVMLWPLSMRLTKFLMALSRRARVVLLLMLSVMSVPDIARVGRL